MGDAMSKLREMLAGKKTYVMSVLMIAYALVGYLIGQTDSINTQLILEALGLATLRAGVSKLG